MYCTSSDIVDHLTNFIVCCSCIGLSFFIFGKIRQKKYVLIFIPFLLFSVFTQTLTEGLNLLTQREGAIYPSKYLWIYDIPNLLSILAMIYLLILIVIKSKKM